MQKLVFFLVMALIAGLIAAGCVSSPNQTTPVTTPTPQIIYVTVTVTPTAAATGVPTAAPVTAATTVANAALFHRWVNTTTSTGTSTDQGSELRFYSDGSLIMKVGSVNEVSSNIMIKNVTEMWVGTWSAVGNDTYLGKLSLSGQTSNTPKAIEVRYYAEGSDPRYPGMVIQEKVVTSDTAYFRAKID